jgi:AcrR family transcriptional regulator
MSEIETIKSQRVKSYFVQAAKEIILDEGVENTSVRKVADKAGYSFATLYNYFTDINELLQEVKVVMIQDVINHMLGKMPDKIYDMDDIKNLHRLYIEYYIDRPNVFSFFYSYRLNTVKVKPTDMPHFEKIWQATYLGMVKSGAIKEAEVEIVAKTIIYTMQGVLALYFSDNGLTTEDVYRDVERIIDHLLAERN